jgi:hypothetical protein
MPFDFTTESFEKKLPAAGAHQATIADVSISEGDDASYMAITFELATGQVISDLVTITADETSPRFADVGRGIQRMQELAKATGTVLADLTDETSIMEAFIGKPVGVVIALRRRSGIKRPVIRLVQALQGGKE